MSSDQQRRDAVDHAANSAADRRQQELKRDLRKYIRGAGSLLSTDRPEDYLEVAVALHDEILPALQEYTGSTLWEIDDQLEGEDEDVEFYFDDLATFATDGLAWQRERKRLDRIFDSPWPPEKEKDRIENALKSVSTVAAGEGIVLEEYDNKADAVGFSTKIGEHRQRRDMDFGDPVEAIVGGRMGTVKSLFSGGTGSGKSTAAEQQFWDYYLRNFDRGSDDCTCIDLADFTSAENVFYDIPQQQPELRHRRKGHDLPADHSEMDVDPEMEIYVPLSQSLDDFSLPYSSVEDEFVPRFFTIPASEISKELFIKIVMARVTATERHTIRNVYETVDRRSDDWVLADMVDELASRSEISDKHKQNAIRVLRSLQDFGFIRSKKSEYTVDWSEIFRDTKTITVFNQSVCESETAKLFVLTWLLEQIREWRDERHQFPQMALLLRELWEYAPHSQRDSDSIIEAELQDRIAYHLTRLSRKNRDYRAHVVCDTQEIMDLNKGVREMFNRYVLFDGNDTVFENVFSWTSNSKWKSFKRTISQRQGECGMVGVVGPAVRDDYEFVSPVRMTPAPFHHHDKDEGSGWLKRVDYTSHESLTEEELRTPDFDAIELPDELKIDENVAASDDDDPRENPVAVFAEWCLVHEKHAKVKKENLRMAFGEFTQQYDVDDDWDLSRKGDQSTFGSGIRSVVDGEIAHSTEEGDPAYKHLKLTDEGEAYVRKAMDGWEPTSEPIRGDD